ncbi:MAG: ferredoxin family protein [Thermoleophilia bacterium]
MSEKKKSDAAANVSSKLGLVKFNPDVNSHLSIIDPGVCRDRCPQKFCTHTCPAQVYRWEPQEESIGVAYEGCLECGTCRSGGCPFRNIEMRYPRGGFGVQYRFG